ncbi:MAG: hypothetical protein WCF65_04820 [Parachlamydiaceae bacterium]
MKSLQMKNLALFGVAAGLFSVGSSGVEATQESNVINLDYVMAKPSCKAHGGCGGDLVATRDRGNVVDSDAALNADKANAAPSSGGSSGSDSGDGDGGNMETSPMDNGGDGGDYQDFDSAPFGD